MNAVREALLQGADFAELARAYSDCPERGGDLGHFSRGRMVAAFDEAVFRLEPGGVSEVFWTEFGFHVVKLTDRQPPRRPAYEEAAGRVHEHLFNERKNRRIGEAVDELRRAATLEFS